MSQDLRIKFVGSAVFEGGKSQSATFYPAGKDATFVVESEKSPLSAADTSVEMLDSTGNTLCHVSLRPQTKLIAVNAKKKGSTGWDQSTQVLLVFDQYLPSSKPAYFKLTDDGETFTINFSDDNPVKVKKLAGLADAEISRVNYNAPAKGESVLSDQIKFTVTLP
ncbi:hypothetical protein BN14_10604 [Rhizoctonia solani AG-1 IB]|uniref:Uncharacterized protein n=1 Tax=Thanatephorus cucumeris (strain AG1-IB / isolate 7/3/14) TaxID=1108050 RepID=M5CAX1_THACB|nr:hypothetical protein BN14_10604 [Rhizoctonia solani AG-1 IB]